MKAPISSPPARTMETSNPVEAIGCSGPVQPTLIKKKELAKRLSVSARSIDGWVARRVIPYLQITPRFYLYEFDAVLAALKKHYQVDAAS
jgi:hypothetical protein